MSAAFSVPCKIQSLLGRAGYEIPWYLTLAGMWIEEINNNDECTALKLALMACLSPSVNRQLHGY